MIALTELFTLREPGLAPGGLGRYASMQPNVGGVK